MIFTINCKYNNMKAGQRQFDRGISLLEVMLVVVVLGSLVAIALPRMMQVRDGVRDTKLQSDVATINGAVKTYLANGGSIPSDASVDDVLLSLKSSVRGEKAETFVGMTGSMLDRRVEPVWMSGDQRQGSDPRAVWNPSSRRFEITTEPVSGIAMFQLGAPVTDEKLPASDARQSSVEYASTSNWIWGYADGSAAPPAGTTEIPLSPDAPDSTPPEPSAPPAPPSGGARLSPPQFSRDPGNYDIGEYQLEVALLNPNPANSSEIQFRRNGGDWVTYAPGTVLELMPDEELMAFTVASHSSDAEPSRIVRGGYTTSPTPLQLSLDSETQSVTYYDLVDGDEVANAMVTNADAFPEFLLRPGFFNTWWAANADPAGADGTLAGGYVEGYQGDQIALNPALWGDERTLDLRAVALSDGGEWVRSSEVASLSIEAVAEQLPPPSITLNEQGEGEFQVSLVMEGRYPPGSQIYFNTAGDPPTWDPETGRVINGQPYEGPFPLNVKLQDESGSGSGDGETIEIGNGIGDVDISQVVLKSKGETLQQNESYDFDQLDDPGFDGARSNEVVDSSNDRITLESITIEQDGETIVADNVNVLQTSVSNLNFPSDIGDNDVTVKRGGKVVARVGDIKDGKADQFAHEIEKSLTSTNLRDYIDYAGGTRELYDSDFDFDVSFSPLTNDDYLVVMERFGNSTFDLRPLDANGELIPGGNRLVFRAYSWNTGHAPSDQPGQAMFFSVIDIEKFGVDTDLNSISGFRVNDDGGADFKFFTIGSESFEDREVRYTGQVQARVFPPEDLRIWFEPSVLASREVEGTTTQE